MARFGAISRKCTKCKKTISIKRLEAQPNARKCITCQQAVDVLPTEQPVNLKRLGRIYLDLQDETLKFDDDNASIRFGYFDSSDNIHGIAEVTA